MVQLKEPNKENLISKTDLIIWAILNGKPNYRSIKHKGITMNITSPNNLLNISKCKNRKY